MLIDCLATTGPLAELFSNRSVLQAMLEFEGALARAAARARAIPQRAADVIVAEARADGFDATVLAEQARSAATPAIPLVEALRARVKTRDPESATFVHWGATSQDVTDTAMVMLLQKARGVIAADHERLRRSLHALSDRHADSLMPGRTLLQPATPITFGLKAAGWHAAVQRAWTRLAHACEATRVLQLGGASGTLAALGVHAEGIARDLARDLHLQAAPPWHTDRDRPGAVATACGLYTAALAKIARDIALLMQAEVAEAAERGGGSSTMPHKRNPAGCTAALAAAARVPGLVAAFLHGMVQEHERSIGGSQAEWPILAGIVQSTGAAAASVADVLEHLEVDPARMRGNLEATGGAVLAERALMLLAARAGRDVAQQLVHAALERSATAGIRFDEALGELPEAVRVLTPEELQELGRLEGYVGLSEELRKRLLEPDASSITLEAGR